MPLPVVAKVSRAKISPSSITSLESSASRDELIPTGDEGNAFVSVNAALHDVVSREVADRFDYVTTSQ